jgi:hypothetical protein
MEAFEDSESSVFPFPPKSCTLTKGSVENLRIHSKQVSLQKATGSKVSKELHGFYILIFYIFVVVIIKF